MPFSSRNKTSNNHPTIEATNALTSQSIEQPRLVCTWSAHATQSDPGPWPSPFPRYRHTLTATSTGELFLIGGLARGRASGNLYVFSTRDHSKTLLQTRGSVPTPRYAHCATLIDTTTLLICGGRREHGERVLDHDSICLLNLGKSDPLMSHPTPADHAFTLQNRESGPAFHQQSVCSGRAVVPSIPHPWSVPSSWSSVVRLTGRPLMICGHSI